MARHANYAYIQAARERIVGLHIPDFELVQNSSHVARAQQEIIEIARFFHIRHALARRDIFPYALIAARVLQKYRSITVRRPIITQISRGLARPPGP